MIPKRLICASRDMRVVGLTSFVMAVSRYVVRLGEALEKVCYNHLFMTSNPQPELHI